MSKLRVKAADITPGMVIDTWFGNWQIERIDPYNGPYDFVIGILVFRGTITKMSLENSACFDVDP
jgi:hypothetical protein